jgi:hypothetical protein
MWQSVEVRGRLSVIRYFVGASEGPIRSFDRAHEAWNYFRELTGVEETNPEVSSRPDRRNR